MKRGQVIKNVILNKCREREIEGYTNLSFSDVTDILNELAGKGIILTHEEMVGFGFEKEYKGHIR